MKKLLSILAALALLVLPSNTAFSQEDAETEEASSGIVDFVRDVRPILAGKCIECHGPDDAKNDWRADEEDSVISYLEAGDLESSSLWTDYLLTDDEDMHMPPMDKPQLTAAELATIKLWIEEGAVWGEAPEDAEAAPEAAAMPSIEDTPVAMRAFEFQGLFHPASVHFPIALLVISTVFLFLSFFNRESFEPAAFHCLWIGALSSVAACIMGWGYAIHEGYGSGYSFDFQNSNIDRHRWLGIAVSAIALILIPMARAVRQRGDGGMRFLWFVGSVIVLLGISTTGYQGGELTYGEDHYEKEYNRLFPASESDELAGSEDVTEVTDEDDTDSPDEGASKEADSDAADASDEPAEETPESDDSDDASS